VITAQRERVERRLAAILAADVVSYSRLIGVDEEGTLRQLKAIQAELIGPRIAAHNGRIFKTTGDGLLAEFGSVVDALRCASEVQTGLAERNAGIASEARIEFRIGIHQGDIVVENGDIFGDGVNIAARLEELAKPGGICVSERVREDAAGKLDLPFADRGEQRLKNIARPVHVYAIDAQSHSLALGCHSDNHVCTDPGWHRGLASMATGKSDSANSRDIGGPKLKSRARQRNRS
jgi:adenylate cyclase